MAIPLGTNDLKIFRRHLKGCSRYPGPEKPPTYRPRTAQEKKADTCECMIWCYGYLAKETHVVNGKIRPKRIGPVSLGVTPISSQKKTGTQCVTPLPPHVKARLDALPGRIENGKTSSPAISGASGASLCGS